MTAHSHTSTTTSQATSFVGRMLAVSQARWARTTAAFDRLATRGQLGPSVGQRDDRRPERFF